MNIPFVRSGFIGIAVMVAAVNIAPIRAADEARNGGQAFDPDIAAAEAGQEEDHQALRRLRALYEQAVAEDDIELLRPHLHPSFTGVMVTGEVIAGFDGMARYRADIKAMMGPGGKYATTVKPDALSRIIGDLAIARGVTDDHVVTGAGREYHFTSPWTAVCIKDDGQWKLLRVQGTMGPIGNPFVAVMNRTYFWLGSAVGAVIGVLIGLAIMMVLRKRGAMQ